MWFKGSQALKLVKHGLNNQKPCMDNENSTKNWKNQLDFIWKDFTSRSQWNKSHSIRRCISWDSIENEFSQSMMKIWSHEVRWKKKLEVGWKNVFVSWNGVRRLRFLTWTNFHTLHTLMNWKFFEIDHNPLNSHKTHTNSHSKSLHLFSKAKMHKWGLRGRKWGVV